MGFLGKLFLTVALTGQAFLLYSNEAVIRDFETNLVKLHGLATLSNPNIPPFVKENLPPVVLQYIQEALQTPLHFRLAVVGLLASSVLLFLSRCAYVAFFPFVGVALQILVQSNPSLDASQNTQVNLLKNLATAGAVLLWSASDCARWAENKAAKAKSS